MRYLLIDQEKGRELAEKQQRFQDDLQNPWWIWIDNDKKYIEVHDDSSDSR